MIWKGAPLGFATDGTPITYEGYPPVLVFGPPGSNKTVGIVANMLLDNDRGGGWFGGQAHSYIVIDPKGECCAITSRFRRTVSDVAIINPYQLLADRRPDMQSVGWNPLADLDDAAQGFSDECAARGDALIKTNANESQPIFPNSARSALTGTINYEVRAARAEGRPPSLPRVREILALESERLIAMVREMMATNDPDIVSRISKFLNDNREIQSIKSNIETDTSWITKPMRDDMNVARGVDLTSVKRRPTTLYIIIPTKELINKAPYLRLLLATLLRHCYRHDGVPVTLLVEEAFVLGHLTELENAASILRGYNGRLVTVYQTLQQIRKHYPDTWGLFGGGATLAFRPGDIDSARFLVEKAGKVTVPVYHASKPTQMGALPGGGWNQQTRERIPLHKMFGMPPGKALVWLPGDEAPRVSSVKGYFEIPQLNRRASPNPYYQGRR